MAADVLTERGPQNLFAHQLDFLGNNMSQKPRDTLQGSFHPVVASTNLPAAYTELADGGDGMPPPPLIDAAPSSKKRKSSKGKMPPELRRPASTPHIRGLTHNDTSPLASPTSEKRRNKLGYHRTSVACGHCRRRKIRCLLAVDDTGGRCLNCIRLKKECYFFPVDQGQGESKGRPIVAADPAPTSAALSANSSPRNSTTSDPVYDGSQAPSQQSHHPFSVHSSKQSSEMDYSGSPMDGSSFQSPTFAYQGMPDSGVPWGQPTLFNSRPIYDDSSTPQSTSEFWAPPHAPSSTMFQNRGNAPVGIDPQNEYYPPTTTDTQSQPWAAMRSMSVGDASQLQHHLQAPYRQATFPGSAYPYNYSQGPNASLAIGPMDQGLPDSSVAPHILASQTFSNDWSAFANNDLETPTAEHHQPPFAQQWFGQASQSTQNHNTTYFPPSTTPG